MSPRLLKFTNAELNEILIGLYKTTNINAIPLIKEFENHLKWALKQ